MGTLKVWVASAVAEFSSTTSSHQQSTSTLTAGTVPQQKQQHYSRRQARQQLSPGQDSRKLQWSDSSGMVLCSLYSTTVDWSQSESGPPSGYRTGQQQSTLCLSEARSPELSEVDHQRNESFVSIAWPWRQMIAELTASACVLLGTVTTVSCLTKIVRAEHCRLQSAVSNQAAVTQRLTAAIRY